MAASSVFNIDQIGMADADSYWSLIVGITAAMAITISMVPDTGVWAMSLPLHTQERERRCFSCFLMIGDFGIMSRWPGRSLCR